MSAVGNHDQYVNFVKDGASRGGEDIGRRIGKGLSRDGFELRSVDSKDGQPLASTICQIDLASAKYEFDARQLPDIKYKFIITHDKEFNSLALEVQKTGTCDLNNELLQKIRSNPSLITDLMFDASKLDSYTIQNGEALIQDIFDRTLKKLAEDGDSQEEFTNVTLGEVKESIEKAIIQSVAKERKREIEAAFIAIMPQIQAAILKGDESVE